ncbi:hypothetical protein CWI37_0029p0050 [Hamiltosporidium tvaerminnensis]|uniref:5'-3' DNA helicase ZGRF1-like N-terminal domain-containing protein n=1 Tax=Hamiltosporidium tvaerminnensis TaxID=1176355 RepID=A0A4Q9LBR1_9MICR|nr:hypothetical protein CWI37_0029p0050 [Hamiltosporidium tvaerminnensis]
MIDCIYTKHIKQKSKKWLDGFFTHSNSILTLYNTEKKKIYSFRIKYIDNEIKTSMYLIYIDNIKQEDLKVEYNKEEDLKEENKVDDKKNIRVEYNRVDNKIDDRVENKVDNKVDDRVDTKIDNKLENKEEDFKVKKYEFNNIINVKNNKPNLKNNKIIKEDNKINIKDTKIYKEDNKIEEQNTENKRKPRSNKEILNLMKK